MLKRISKIAFTQDEGKKNELISFINENKDKPGALMPILQKAQAIYGYLPEEVQKIVAEELGISTEEVFGVSTFYSQFALSPKGKYNISICLGTACYVKGSGDILNKVKEILKIEPEDCTMDGKFSLTACRCVGACGLAPVMMINDDVYGRLTPDQVPEIIKKYS